MIGLILEHLCFSSHTKKHSLSVALGKNALNETDLTVEQTFRVEEIIIHEGFDNSEGNFNNDIGTNMCDCNQTLKFAKQ